MPNVLDLDKLTAKPKAVLRAGFFGNPKCGKTHNGVLCALAAYKILGLKGHIACLDTKENFVADWYDRILEVTGKPPVTFLSDDPVKGLQFCKACEQDDRIDLIVIDSVTELLERCRKDWLEANPNAKMIPLGEYPRIDRPFGRFQDWLKGTQIHTVCTMREKDDKQAVDGQEIVIGKVGRGKDAGFVPRLWVHCTRAKLKGRVVHRLEVTTTTGESETVDNPPAEYWDKHVVGLKPVPNARVPMMRRMPTDKEAKAEARAILTSVDAVMSAWHLT